MVSLSIDLPTPEALEFLRIFESTVTEEQREQCQLTVGMPRLAAEPLKAPPRQHALQGSNELIITLASAGALNLLEGSSKHILTLEGRTSQYVHERAK